jgi:uroporphyrinogen-III synthase
VAEAQATAERVRALGFEPVVAPLLDVQTLAIDAATGFDGVVITSGNALASLEVYAGLPLLAVGDATAQRARQAGFHTVFSAGGDAVALARAAPSHFRMGARLLFATAAGEGAPLEKALRHTGFTVDRRVAYAVHPAPSLPVAAHDVLLSGRLHAALFLSARTARIFAGLLDRALHPHLAGAEALTIGQPAADALTPLPWRRVRVSLAPTLDQVLALL